MSIRAYLIKEIKKEKSESFNLSHDEEFMQILQEAAYLETLDIDGSGFIEVPKSFLKEVLEDKEIPKSENTIKIIKSLLKLKTKGYDDWILFKCF